MAGAIRANGAERQLWRGGAICLGWHLVSGLGVGGLRVWDPCTRSLTFATRSVAMRGWRFGVHGRGPHEIVCVAAGISNQDFEPRAGAGPGLFWGRLHSFATVVSYDARGTGLSDPVSLTDLPTLESSTDDLHAVVTAAGLERVTVLAHHSSGQVAALYAATHPNELTR